MKLLRRFWWPIISRFLIIQVERHNSMFSYPIIFWTTFTGKNMYINLGRKAFVDGYLAELNRLAGVITEALTPDHLKPTCKRANSKTHAINWMRAFRKQKQDEQDQLDRLIDDLDSRLDYAVFDKQGNASL